MKSQVKRIAKKIGKAKNRIKNRIQRPDLYSLSSKERVGIVIDNPSEMSVSERLFLYALVRGVRPQRVLEIGSRHGGSASIMAAAMMDNESATARIIGIDPGPDITVPKSQFFDKFELIVQPSPEGITEARSRAGGQFDFILIDGLHIYTQVKKDLLGVLPHLAENCYILLHDSFHLGISTAITEVVSQSPGLLDCGYPCAKPSLQKGSPLAYGGFRLLLHRTSPTTDATSYIDAEASVRGFAPLPTDPDLADHDPYWHCRKVKPCAYCVKTGANK